MVKKPVGLLALQGDFALHAAMLKRMGVRPVEVRTVSDLKELDHLILPGGESSTMLKLMEGTGLCAGIQEWHARGGFLFGTCAGLILLAHSVHGPEQPSFDLIDVDVTRNAYGRQSESFETDLKWREDSPLLRAVFIRAPRITRTGGQVEVLASLDQEPVVVRHGRVLASSFHPEMTEDTRMHEYFLNMQPETPCAVS